MVSGPEGEKKVKSDGLSRHAREAGNRVFNPTKPLCLSQGLRGQLSREAQFHDADKGVLVEEAIHGLLVDGAMDSGQEKYS